MASQTPNPGPSPKRKFQWLTRDDIIWLVVMFALFCLLFLLATGCAFCTTLTGTIKQQGQPFTGYVTVNLVYPGTDGTSLTLPGSSGKTPIYNGNFPAMTVAGNDTLLPRGTYYQVTYFDIYSAPVARMNYVITGATYDIGTAVPTPVTTSNINFLDLLGLRNLSVQNLTITGGGGITLGTTHLGATGVTGAPQLNDTRWAVGYLSGSTTCGVQEAINSLGAAGGTVYVQGGSCTVTSTINITTPIRLVGMGGGGYAASTPTFTFPSELIDGGVGDLISISAPTSTILSGVSIENMALYGPGAGSTVNGVTVSGAGTVQGLLLANTTIAKFAVGLNVTGTTKGLAVRGSLLSSNGVGASFTGTSTATVFAGGYVDLSVGDGLLVNSATNADFTLSGVGLTNNGNNGLEVTAASVASTVHASASTFGNNTNAGALISGGSGHVIESSEFPVGTRQQYGVYDNQPALADAYTTQLTLRDDNLQGALTDDIYTTATPSYILIYPLAEQIGSSAVHYSFGTPANIHFVQPAVTTTATDYYFSFTGCNLNVGGNSVNCQGTQSFATVTPTVPTQPDTNYYLGCSMYTGLGWGSSTNVNTPNTTSFEYTENVDRWNSISGNVNPTLYCHLHHN